MPQNGAGGGNTNSGGATPSPSSLTAADIPRPKRIACVVCRKRKLRCDGIKPSCGTCSRLGHDWSVYPPDACLIKTNNNSAYDEIRRKSGPKRGYVKALEARLGMKTPLPLRACVPRSSSFCTAQVETLLKDQSAPHTPDRAVNLALLPFPAHQADPLLFGNDAAMDGMDPLLGQQQQHDSPLSPNPLSHYSFHCSPMMGVPPPWSAQLPQTSNQPMSWDMIAMGLEEALPDQDVVDAL